MGIFLRLGETGAATEFILEGENFSEIFGLSFFHEALFVNYEFDGP